MYQHLFLLAVFVAGLIGTQATALPGVAAHAPGSASRMPWFAEAIVTLADEDHLHARALGRAHPGVGVVVLRIELRGDARGLGDAEVSLAEPGGRA